MDRCSPDYAVRTLEVLKHFFDVSGFVFVLAIDENHLESSVKCLFGTENFEGYKRKFINNTFLLPTPDKKAFAEFLYDKSDIDTIIKKIQEEKRELVFLISIYNVFRCTGSYSRYMDFQGEIEAKKYNALQTSESIIKRYFAAYSIWFKFSLRQMEQVFDRLTIFIKQIASGHEIFSPDLAVFLVCLHEFDIRIFNALRNAPYPVNQSILSTISYGEQSYAKRVLDLSIMKSLILLIEIWLLNFRSLKAIHSTLPQTLLTKIVF